MRYLEMPEGAQFIRLITIGVCAVILVVLVFVSANQAGLHPQTDTAVFAQNTEMPAARDSVDVFLDERTLMRQNITQGYLDVMENAQLEESVKSEAQRAYMNVLKWVRQENNVEGILKLQGWEDAVCIVSDQGVNVVVKAQSLTREQAAGILSVVTRETGRLGGDVKVIPVNGM